MSSQSYSNEVRLPMKEIPPEVTIQHNKVNTLRGSPQSLSYCKCVIKSMSLLPIHLGISDHCTVPHRSEYLSKKSETVYPPICGILKLSVLLNQKIVKLPIKMFKQSQNGGISFQAKLKNNLNSHPKYKKGIKRGPSLKKKGTLTLQEGYILQFQFFSRIACKVPTC